MSARPALDRLPPRLVVSSLAGGRAMILGAAAWVLPWQELSFFAIEVGLCALADALLAGGIWRLTPARWLALWRVGSWLAVMVLVHLSWQVVAAGVYLNGLYGALGQGVAIAALAGLSAALLVFLPFSWWGLACAGLGAPSRMWQAWSARRRVASTALLVTGVGWSLLATRAYAAGEALGVDVEHVNLPSSWRVPAASAPARLTKPATQTRPARCESHPSTWASSNEVIVLVGERTASGEVLQECWTLAAADWQRELLRRLTAAQGQAGRTFAIDIVTRVQRLDAAPWPLATPAAHAIAAPFALRAGLDGICVNETCLAPWQLIARSAFSQFRPLVAIPDLRVGVDWQGLAASLQSSAPEQASTSQWRIATDSYALAADGKIVPLLRQRQPPQRMGERRWRRAATLAQEYIVRAAQADGSFIYLYDPLSEAVDTASVSLPRHAGTTLALCELSSRTPEVDAVIGRALGWLARREVAAGPWRVLERMPNLPTFSLGDVTLPLSALARCRSRLGPQHDRLMRDLAKVLAWMQRDNGSFTPKFDRNGAKIEGPTPLYAEGQAVLAWIEVIRAGILDPEAEALARAGLRKTMDYIAYAYWDHALAPFFFLEENWHCIAARAALDVERHDGYERFCLDYLRFKSRLILDDASEVAADLRGGYGFGNLVVPHVTPAAGFIEAAAAGVAVARARGEDTVAQTQQLASVLDFVAASQWDDAVCGACADPARARGGFAESKVNPAIRIDFVQHAWSALHYGMAVQPSLAKHDSPVGDGG